MKAFKLACLFVCLLFGSFIQLLILRSDVLNARQTLIDSIIIWIIPTAWLLVITNIPFISIKTRRNTFKEFGILAGYKFALN